MKKLEEFRKRLAKDVSKSTGGGDVTYIRQKEIGESMFIRVLPPHPNIEPMFYVPKITYFIKPSRPGGDWLVKDSPEAFDLTCPIAEELEIARKSGNPDLERLAAKVEKSNSFLIPFLHLSIDDNNEVSIIGDKPKVLEAGVMITQSIADKMMSRHYQNGTEAGLLDAEKGWNLEVIRKKKGNKVEYFVEVDPQPMGIPLEYLEEEFNLLEIRKKGIDSNDDLRAWIRGYLYGETVQSSSQKIEPARRIVRRSEPTESKIVKPEPKKRSVKSSIISAIEDAED